MTVPFVLSASASTPAMSDLPAWAPVVFGIGSLLVLTLVIVLARRKTNESQRWQDARDRDGRDTKDSPDTKDFPDAKDFPESQDFPGSHERPGKNDDA